MRNGTLGSVGDIILADLGEILLGDRTGGVETSASIHVKFLQAETAFRFIWRCDAMPSWSSPTTPLNGTATVSPFVTLAGRS